MLTREAVVIGAGAAGLFAAIQAASLGTKVTLLEKTRRPLAKVRISGGGRCNVTHAAFEPKELIKNYPRGSKALLGPFTRFGPRETVQWFESRQVRLKTEADGRIFPVSDSSQTIIDCLMQEAAKLPITLSLETGVDAIQKSDLGFQLQLATGQTLPCQKLLVASGSSRQIVSLIASLGHTIVEPVPSLFTFNIANFPLVDLAGVSVPKAAVSTVGLTQVGPLLITHWGFSGPGVLKLSAFGARLLHDRDYNAPVEINWLADLSVEAKQEALLTAKGEQAKKQIANYCPFNLPQSLWRALLTRGGIESAKRYADLSKAETRQLLDLLHRDRYQISGQTTYKEEFVTSGGVSLDEVNFKTMQSKIVPGLYFAGEVLDIDGITGGFNFQNAWTTAHIAGTSLAMNKE